MDKHRRVSFIVDCINEFDGDNLSLKTKTEIKSIISRLSLRETKSAYEQITSPEYCEFRECLKTRIMGFVRA